MVNSGLTSSLPLAHILPGSPSLLKSQFRNKNLCGAHKTHNRFKINGSHKVALLGASRDGGSSNLVVALSLTPSVSSLHVYEENRKREIVSLSNSKCEVKGFSGDDGLIECVENVDVVIITPSVEDSWGDGHFYISALRVKKLIELVADRNPEAFIVIVSNRVDATMALAAEVMKRKGVFDPKKMVGLTKWEGLMAQSIVSQKEGNLVNFPVVGGFDGHSFLPLLSKAKPPLNLSEEEMEQLTVQIRKAISFTRSAKSGSCFMWMAEAMSMGDSVLRFVISLLEAFDGAENVYECGLVASTGIDLPFFASTIKLGTDGIESVMDSDIDGLSEYEKQELELLKPSLKASIEKGIAFV